MSRLLGLIGLSWASDTARALKAAGEAHDLADGLQALCDQVCEAVEKVIDERDDYDKRLRHARASLEVAIDERNGAESFNRVLMRRINAAKALATPSMAPVGRRMKAALDGKDVATVTRALRQHVAEVVA